MPVTEVSSPCPPRGDCTTARRSPPAPGGPAYVPSCVPPAAGSMLPPRLAAVLQAGHHLQHLADTSADLLALLAQHVDLLGQLLDLLLALFRSVDLRLRRCDGLLQLPA